VIVIAPTAWQRRARPADLVPELMDDPAADPAELQCSLRFIRRINVLLGYTRASLHHLAQFSRSWKRGQTIRIVDLATGSADIPEAICRWADRRGWDVRIVGVERHEATAAIAASRAAANPRIKIVRGDVLHIPLADGSFDYALTGMFLHHLSDEQAVEVLRTMDRLARRGVIVADLLRHRRAYGWIRLLTALSNPMVRHDAPLSVAQAFSEDEAVQLARRAGLDYLRYSAHFGHRFVLAGEKDGH
jgi:ubiquinone/menaquinone biosynthesis C-methylase UbiE